MSHLEKFMQLMPKGAYSYPECKTKVSVVREAVDAKMRLAILPRLSTETKELLVNLPPDSTWIPEVQAQEVFSAVADELGAERFLSLVYERLRDLLSSPLYYALFRMMSSKRIVKMAAVGWTRFHVGTEIKPIGSSPKNVELELTYPMNLFSEVMNQAHALGVRVALEVGGTKTTRARLQESSPTRSVISVEWE